MSQFALRIVIGLVSFGGVVICASILCAIVLHEVRSYKRLQNYWHESFPWAILLSLPIAAIMGLCANIVCAVWYST